MRLDTLYISCKCQTGSCCMLGTPQPMQLSVIIHEVGAESRFHHDVW